VCKGAVRPVLDAEAPVVGVVDTHPRLVILQVVPTFRVSGRSMQQRTTERKLKNSLLNIFYNIILLRLSKITSRTM
jgi:hypothetical protein